VGFELVLHPPIETARITGQVVLGGFYLSGWWRPFPLTGISTNGLLDAFLLT
jgi:hypothetical protein